MQVHDREVCIQLCQKGSLTFAYAQQFLPNNEGEADGFMALYSFLRIADDAIDEASTQKNREINLKWLKEWVSTIYSKKQHPYPPSTLIVRIIKETKKLRRCIYHVHRSMIWATQKWNIPKDVIDKIIEGFLWDNEQKEYNTLQDLEDYCDRVATFVGVALTHIMTHGDDEKVNILFPYIRSLGRALQLTNIARDLEEDILEHKRIYIPKQWIPEKDKVRQQQYVIDNPLWTENSRKLLLEKAMYYYEECFPGIHLLPNWRFRWAVGTAALSYRLIGTIISYKHKYKWGKGRATTTKFQKLLCALKAFFMFVICRSMFT